MARQCALDTETTGFDPATGDKLVEIGVAEMIDGIATGREFHSYVNPCRDVPISAVQVHGLTGEFLRDKPLFDEVAPLLMEFLGDAELVIHNAEFDLKFLDAELGALNLPKIDRTRVVDSLDLARRKFPGSPASLDALCRRFSISLGTREHHGALIDAKLLSQVYLELTGGRQRTFELMFGGQGTADAGAGDAPAAAAPTGAGAGVLEPTAEEAAAHEALLSRIPDPIWKRTA